MPKQRSPWLEAMLARRPKNVVAVALANKMATAWAQVAHGRDYQAGGFAQNPSSGGLGESFGDGDVRCLQILAH